MALKFELSCNRLETFEPEVDSTGLVVVNSEGCSVELVSPSVLLCSPEPDVVSGDSRKKRKTKKSKVLPVV